MLIPRAWFGAICFSCLVWLRVSHLKTLSCTTLVGRALCLEAGVLLKDLDLGIDLSAWASPSSLWSSSLNCFALVQGAYNWTPGSCDSQLRLMFSVLFLCCIGNHFTQYSATQTKEVASNCTEEYLATQAWTTPCVQDSTTCLFAATDPTSFSRSSFSSLSTTTDQHNAEGSHQGSKASTVEVSVLCQSQQRPGGRMPILLDSLESGRRCHVHSTTATERQAICSPALRMEVGRMAGGRCRAHQEEEKKISKHQPQRQAACQRIRRSSQASDNSQSFSTKLWSFRGNRSNSISWGSYSSHASGTPSPWITEAKTETSPPPMNHGLLMAVKRRYPDMSKAPADIRLEVEKTERIMQKTKGTLKEELMDTTAQFGAARDHLMAVVQAQEQHRVRWLRHLGSSVQLWNSQLASYNKQSAQYQTMLAEAQENFEEARTANQTMNQKAGTVDISPTLIDPPASEAAEGQTEAELRERVAMLLASSDRGCCHPDRIRERGGREWTTYQKGAWWCQCNLVIQGSVAGCLRKTARVPSKHVQWSDGYNHELNKNTVPHAPASSDRPLHTLCLAYDCSYEWEPIADADWIAGLCVRQDSDDELLRLRAWSRSLGIVQQVIPAPLTSCDFEWLDEEPCHSIHDRLHLYEQPGFCHILYRYLCESGEVMATDIGPTMNIVI